MWPLALTEIVRAVSASALLFFSLCFFWIAFRIFRSSANEYERNRSQAKSPLDVFLGRVPTKRDGVRNHNVAAGVAIDRRSNRWIEQGRYSDEAIHDVLTP